MSPARLQKLLGNIYNTTDKAKITYRNQFKMAKVIKRLNGGLVLGSILCTG